MSKCNGLGLTGDSVKSVIRTLGEESRLRVEDDNEEGVSTAA